MYAKFSAFEKLKDAAVWRFTYNDQTVALQTGQMTKLLNVLDGCERDLLKRWKIDPAEIDRPEQRAEPIGDPGYWFDNGFYPAAAKAAGIEGRVFTYLTIDINGRVSDCRPLGDQSDSILAKATCARFIKNGRYKPPHDASGKPMISHQIAPPVDWHLINVP